MAVRRVVGLVQNGFVAGLTVPAHGFKVFASARLAKKAGAFGIKAVIRKRTNPRGGTFCAWYIAGQGSPLITL